MGDDGRMTAARLAVIVTCVVVTGLAALFAFGPWDAAGRIGTVLSVLAAVAAVGVAVWAGLPHGTAGSLASRTGAATASGPGSLANSGVIGSDTSTAEATGDARADGGGSANSGVDMSR